MLMNWNHILVLLIQKRSAWKTDCSAAPNSSQMEALIPTNSAVIVTQV